jgi:hypothetical protein
VLRAGELQKLKKSQALVATKTWEEALKKFGLLLALGLSFAVLSPELASAQSLEGRWYNTGRSSFGSNYTAHVMFSRNGTMQYEMAAAPSPGANGSVNQCQGRFDFDGQMLATEGTCSNGLRFDSSMIGGPLQVIDNNTITISGDVWRRD